MVRHTACNEATLAQFLRRLLDSGTAVTAQLLQSMYIASFADTGLFDAAVGLISK